MPQGDGQARRGPPEGSLRLQAPRGGGLRAGGDQGGGAVGQLGPDAVHLLPACVQGEVERHESSRHPKGEVQGAPRAGGRDCRGSQAPAPRGEGDAPDGEAGGRAAGGRDRVPAEGAAPQELPLQVPQVPARYGQGRRKGHVHRLPEARGGGLRPVCRLRRRQRPAVGRQRKQGGVRLHGAPGLLLHQRRARGGAALHRGRGRDDPGVGSHSEQAHRPHPTKHD
mmetsp:Transcript_9230/g.21569  ORF Transcript_9230/g.21569 Transcript_9230/m.21569 type:complete len:224 (-) Transcript_9230:743-1414(-)